RSGDTFTKLANPADLPTGNGNGTAFSPDSQYMSVAHDTSPYITIYKYPPPQPSLVVAGNSQLTSVTADELQVTGAGSFDQGLQVSGGATIQQGLTVSADTSAGYAATFTNSGDDDDRYGISIQ